MNARALLSTRKGLFEASREGGHWSLREAGFAGEPVSCALHDSRDGAVYAALNLGHFGVKLHRREPDTEAWSEIGVPVYPPQQPAQQDAQQKDVEWTLQMIWSLAAGGNDAPGVLWAGTLPGGLFRSADRGTSWELVRSLWDEPSRPEWFGGGYDVPGLHSICVDPRDSRHLLVGISCGGAWVTRDGGASWKAAVAGMRAAYMPPERAEEPAVQDPHLIAQCRASPDVYWCQHHNGIWRSADGAGRWEEIGPAARAVASDFGFAVAAHPADPLTAWFVPAIADERRIPIDAALCVTRTRDGGKSFEALREGLPQRQCYDLVYRHGLAVAPDGRTLLIGSTTGSVWASGDGGERWELLSAHLPPVYAVTFF
ncbi:MAG TPA: exo-alpha-sialidase [Noviherbaspirillum sp.]|nr:exo-alpha-sialidase [Noviherbaspirillum sp.]